MAPPRAKPTLDEIAESLAPIFEPYAKKLTNKSKNPLLFDLWGKKQAFSQGKMRDEISFVGIMKQKDYIGFYFMPIYTHPDRFADIPPELRKCLKGKSCFYIKTIDPELHHQIKAVMRDGFALYKELGWV